MLKRAGQGSKSAQNQHHKQENKKNQTSYHLSYQEEIELSYEEAFNSRIETADSMNSSEDGEPVYSSQTPHSSVEIHPHGDYGVHDGNPQAILTTMYEELLKEEAGASLTDSDSDQSDSAYSEQDSLADSDSTSPAATPAVMARKRQGSGTFPSLDSRSLPIVREYSAGGLVFDDRNRVAIIVRHSRSGHIEWCIPKGHIEEGETPDQTAVREVHEETGIMGKVVDSIATIDYWFTGTTQRVHKLVHHYVLKQIGGHLTVEGDPDHEAEDAIWVDFNDLQEVLSYPNERRIAWLYARKNKKAHEADHA